MSQHDAIPLLVPRLPDSAALQPYLARIDARRHYSNFGPLVKSLEHRLQQLFESRTTFAMHVSTVSSATAGLELALGSLDLPRGSHVLVPALTFVATLTAVIRAGLVPVVADIDAQSWLLSPEIAKTYIAKHDIRAAIVVATFGQPQDTNAWSSFQKATGVRIVVDAAGAFGSQWVDAEDIPVVFSMHATKSLAAGEGGFVVSGNPRINTLITQLSNFGINLDPAAGLPVGHLSYVGSNAKLSEYHAAVAHASLDVWNETANLRSTIYQRYKEALDSACGDAIEWQSGVRVAAPSILCIRAGSQKKRHRLEQLCSKRQIGTRRWYQPLLHQHATQVAPLIATPCPVAERIATDLIGLPFSVFITDAHIERIVDTVCEAIGLTVPQHT